MSLAELRWPVSLGEALILRPPDLAELFRLPERHSVFIEFIEVLGVVLDGGGGTTSMFFDEMEMETRTKAPMGTDESGMTVTEAVLIVGGSGERIGGQLGGVSKNSLTFIMASSDPIIINPVRAPNELIRRSLCIFKDSVADDYLYRFTFRRVPLPMKWQPESDLGNLQKVTGEQTVAGSERFQPLKSAGEEYHVVGGAGE